MAVDPARKRLREVLQLISKLSSDVSGKTEIEREFKEALKFMKEDVERPFDRGVAKLEAENPNSSALSDLKEAREKLGSDPNF